MLKQVAELKTGIDINTNFPLINAVLNGVQQGNIFEDETSLLIIHKAGFSFFKPKNAAVDYSNFTKLILSSPDVPKYFHIYDPPVELIAALNKDNRFQTRIRKRIHLKHTGKRLSLKFSAAENYPVQEITENNFESFSVFDLDIANKFWSSKEDFLNNGFGFFVTAEDNKPVSVCYAACVASGQAEIDIATLKPYQQKGLAKTATEKFVEHCIDNNVTANWDCFEDNNGSLKVAEQVGFKASLNYNFLSIFIN